MYALRTCPFSTSLDSQIILQSFQTEKEMYNAPRGKERGASHSHPVGRLKVLWMIQVSSSECASWQGVLQMYLGLDSGFSDVKQAGKRSLCGGVDAAAVLPTAVSNTFNDLYPQSNIYHVSPTYL